MHEMSISQTELEAIGYINYRERITTDKYSELVLPKIIEHRDEILNKYARNNSADNQPGVMKQKINTITGMGFADGLLVPLNYDGVFVDADDIFAVTYRKGYAGNSVKNKNEEYVLWIIFTNDAYVPMLPMVCIQKYNFMDRFSKKEKNDFKSTIEKMCHNLKYPVISVEQLQEIIESEYSVRGTVSKAFMLEQLYDSLNQIGFFDPNTISCEFGERTIALLRKYEYDI